jgi:hypothetical protein
MDIIEGSESFWRRTAKGEDRDDERSRLEKFRVNKVIREEIAQREYIDFIYMKRETPDTTYICTPPTPNSTHQEKSRRQDIPGGSATSLIGFDMCGKVIQ